MRMKEREALHLGYQPPLGGGSRWDWWSTPIPPGVQRLIDADTPPEMVLKLGINGSTNVTSLPTSMGRLSAL